MQYGLSVIRSSAQLTTAHNTMTSHISKVILPRGVAFTSLEDFYSDLLTSSFKTFTVNDSIGIMTMLNQYLQSSAGNCVPGIAVFMCIHNL